MNGSSHGSYNHISATSQLNQDDFDRIVKSTEKSWRSTEDNSTASADFATLATTSSRWLSNNYQLGLVG